eukprot:scaffold104542_cov51-Phaeocystis_antarctica.AAC.2
MAAASSMAGSTSMAVDARTAMAGFIAPTRIAAWKPSTAGAPATSKSSDRSSMAGTRFSELYFRGVKRGLS